MQKKPAFETKTGLFMKIYLQNPENSKIFPLPEKQAPKALNNRPWLKNRIFPQRACFYWL
jgi:hypothetical protein